MTVGSLMTHGMSHMARYWPIYLCVASSLCVLSVFARMSRTLDLQVVGVAGILLTLLWSLVFFCTRPSKAVS